MSNYEPEIGQYVFGQPYQEYSCSNLLLAALRYIDDELRRVMRNIHQSEYESPFSNTGASYTNDVFEAHAYSWNENVEQPFNFKWKTVEISWYKYLGRGMSCNQELSPDTINALLDECLKSIQKEDTC